MRKPLPLRTRPHDMPLPGDTAPHQAPPQTRPHGPALPWTRPHHCLSPDTPPQACPSSLRHPSPPPGGGGPPGTLCRDPLFIADSTHSRWADSQGISGRGCLSNDLVDDQVQSGGRPEGVERRPFLGPPRESPASSVFPRSSATCQTWLRQFSCLPSLKLCAHACVESNLYPKRGARTHHGDQQSHALLTEPARFPIRFKIQGCCQLYLNTIKKIIKPRDALETHTFFS